MSEDERDSGNQSPEDRREQAPPPDLALSEERKGVIVMPVNSGEGITITEPGGLPPAQSAPDAPSEPAAAPPAEGSPQAPDSGE